MTHIKTICPLYLAFLIALVGCSVSLYYGEILLVEPCRLCWYQRIALFPLVLILGIGAYRGDYAVARYALPLSLFGALVAFYQALALHFPSLQVCGKECSQPVFSLLGFITLPDLSALGFFGICALLYAALRQVVRT